MEEVHEVVLGRVGGGGGGGGGGCGAGTGDGAATETAPEESKATWDDGIILASLYLYFNISVLTAFSSACKDWTCCCKAEIAPMHP